MLVQKFGGSSVEDAGKMRQVAEIALSHRIGGRIAIVLPRTTTPWPQWTTVTGKRPPT